MPCWRVIVSRIGRVRLDWQEDYTLVSSGLINETYIETEGKAPSAAAAAEAVRKAAWMLAEVGNTFSPPHLQVYFDDLTVLDGYINSRLEWPFPDFFWRWADKFSSETRARLDPVSAAGCTELVAKWAELGKKIRLVLDDERRNEVQYLVRTLLPVIPGLGLQPADREAVYEAVARVAWLSAQPDLILTAGRQQSLDVVLSTLDALIR